MTTPNSGLLSSRGFDAQSDRSWSRWFEMVLDVHDERTNPNGFTSMGIAENRLMHKELTKYINENFKMPERALTYADGGFGSKELRTTLAKFLTEHLKSRESIPQDNVICFPGVTTGIESIATMIANPGEGILLGRPYYNSFLHDLGIRAGVKTVTVSFGSVDQFTEESIAKYEEALLASEKEGVKIRGIILCSPHNPLGRCYPRNVLIGFLKLCQKYQIHLISDEIYALSIWENKDYPDAVPFTSVLEINSPDIVDSRLVHLLWGVSKDFGANGLRIGCIITANEPMRWAMMAHSLFTYISGAADKMAVDLLSNSAFVSSYIKENQTRLAHAYSHTVSFFKQKKIPYYEGSNAAFFVWVELRTTYLKSHGRSTDVSFTEGAEVDQEIFNKLLELRVLIGLGSAYGDEFGGWFRLVFTYPDDYLDTGLDKIWQVVSGDQNAKVEHSLSTKVSDLKIDSVVS